MTAEEYSLSSNEPYLSDSEGETLRFILNCLKKACPSFKEASSQKNLRLPLNENKYTIIYVEQVEVFVKIHPNIGIKNQYSDTFYGTKGIPDFYFHIIEEGRHHQPLFVGEAKILPTPGHKKREREYVIGSRNNGGIERFKNEKHGKELGYCGLVGFIEKGEPRNWLSTINDWIKDLALTDNAWNLNETLIEEELNTNFYYSKSIAHREKRDVKLFHLWITFT